MEVFLDLFLFSIPLLKSLMWHKYCIYIIYNVRHVVLYIIYNTIYIIYNIQFVYKIYKFV